MSTLKQSFYSLTFQGLQSLLLQNDLHPSGASRLFNWHYKKKHAEPCHQDLSRETQCFLKEKVSFDLPKIDEVHEASDRTVKFLFCLKDGLKVETVLIPFQNKYTICLSTQVGCAMQCTFCFTGTQGLKRNLTTDEIMGQFLEVYRWLGINRPNEQRILNVVFMGQGEPLHNFDAVKAAIEIFIDKHGTCLALHRITVSTAGYLPGLIRWNDEMPNVNIALSLHSPFAEKRNKLIPMNQGNSLEDVIHCLDQIPLTKKRFVTYEYLIIKDFNDSPEDAHATGKLLEGKKALINLIPFNPFPGSEYKRPEDLTIEAFKIILDSYKIPTMIRTTKGEDILAACGQLNTRGKA